MIYVRTYVRTHAQTQNITSIINMSVRYQVPVRYYYGNRLSTGSCFLTQSASNFFFEHKKSAGIQRHTGWHRTNTARCRSTVLYLVLNYFGATSSTLQYITVHILNRRVDIRVTLIFVQKELCHCYVILVSNISSPVPSRPVPYRYCTERTAP